MTQYVEDDHFCSQVLRNVSWKFGRPWWRLLFVSIFSPDAYILEYRQVSILVLFPLFSHLESVCVCVQFCVCGVFSSKSLINYVLHYVIMFYTLYIMLIKDDLHILPI